MYGTSHLASIVFYCHLPPPSMLTKGSSPDFVNMAPLGGLVALQLWCDSISESSDNCLWNCTGKVSHLGQQTNQYHPLQEDRYTPAQQPYSGAPQFYRDSLFNMTPSGQYTTSPSQWIRSYGPQWQGCDRYSGGYGGSQIFPPLHFLTHGLSFPCALRVLSGRPENNTVNRPTSSSFSTPPAYSAGISRKPPVALWTK